MENDRVVLLVAIIGVFVVIIIALALRNRIKSTTTAGPLSFKFGAKPRGATLKGGAVSDSDVVNEGAGGPAEMEVRDITNSSVINTAGNVRKD